MKLFRWEDDEGNGPYYKPGAMELFGEWHDDDAHPTPVFDGLPEYFSDGGWRCAFSSEAQADVWFSPSERETLRARGFGLVEFEVDAARVHLGTKQAIFQINARKKRLD